VPVKFIPTSGRVRSLQLKNISHWPDARLFVPLPEKKNGAHTEQAITFLEILQIKLHASEPNCGHKFSNNKM
jgi:hypothetical protein